MQNKYIVTALNKLMGAREAISKPAPRDAAEKMMQRAQTASHGKRNQAYSNIRLELVQPEQLQLEFQDEGLDVLEFHRGVDIATVVSNGSTIASYENQAGRNFHKTLQEGCAYLRAIGYEYSSTTKQYRNG